MRTKVGLIKCYVKAKIIMISKQSIDFESTNTALTEVSWKQFLYYKLFADFSVTTVMTTIFKLTQKF